MVIQHGSWFLMVVALFAGFRQQSEQTVCAMWKPEHCTQWKSEDEQENI